ncbi:MAG: hypothetical protein HGB05_15625 [Chloroflexi bacterium]|nr:hypothetical protein [Chloroflexota bacterium]
MALPASRGIPIDDWMGCAVQVGRVFGDCRWIAAMTTDALHGRFADAEPLAGVMQVVQIFVTTQTGGFDLASLRLYDDRRLRNGNQQQHASQRDNDKPFSGKETG